MIYKFIYKKGLFIKNNIISYYFEPLAIKNNIDATKYSGASTNELFTGEKRKSYVVCRIQKRHSWFKKTKKI